VTRLGLNTGLEPRLQRSSCYEVHAHTEGVLEKKFEAHETVERRGADEVHENVDVTRFGCLVASDGTEDGELTDAESRLGFRK
jgi:hypothetical protein